MKAFKWCLAVFAGCVLKCVNAQTLTLTHPTNQQTFFLSRWANGADVPLRYTTKGFDLYGDRRICWSIFRTSILGVEEAYGIPSCFDNHQELTVRALPKGQYRVFGSLVVSGAVVANSPSCGFQVMDKFWPSYDWQHIHTSQDIPAGMEVSMPLDGSGLKQARIPPLWRLQLYLGPVAGFLRMDVRRSTTVLQVKQAAAEHIMKRYTVKGVEVPAGTCVGIVKDEVVVPHTSTVEEVDWFTEARA
eukprot:CAMPEP_0118954004 /NCGR_PEP_ID=MMETSP1169-20130426/57550_1 /TAXON_ID=36882 /ORGANISM="Pyramimonas obovata, Strain CCMP722" /LENGTH=244 /DNA_ID=CAMNT_0006901571 /DNA_START=229 /DNA_END=960 /DNA_ORIENTATION=+